MSKPKPGAIYAISNTRHIRILDILNSEHCYVEFKDPHRRDGSIYREGEWHIELPVIPISYLKDKKQDIDALLLLIRHGNMPSIEQRLAKCKIVFEEIKRKAKDHCPKYRADGSIVQSKDRHQRCIEMGINHYPKSFLQELLKKKPEEHKQTLEDSLTRWKILLNQPEGRAVKYKLKNFKVPQKPKPKKHWQDRTSD